jgi:hypothetical protein
MFGSCDQGVSVTGVDEAEVRESAIDDGGEASMKTLGKNATIIHAPTIFSLFLKYIMLYNNSLCAQPEDFKKAVASVAHNLPMLLHL